MDPTPFDKLIQVANLAYLQLKRQVALGLSIVGGPPPSYPFSVFTQPGFTDDFSSSPSPTSRNIPCSPPKIARDQMPQEPPEFGTFFGFMAYFSNSQEMGRNQFRNHDPDAQLALTINADGTNVDGEVGLQTSIRFNPTSSTLSFSNSSSESVLPAPTPPAMDTASDIFPLTSMPIFGPDALHVHSRSRPHSCPPVYGRTPEPLWLASSPSVPSFEVDGHFNSGFEVDQEDADFELEFGGEEVDIDDDGESMFFGTMESVDVEDDGELIIFDWMTNVDVEDNGELMFFGEMEDL